MFLTYFVTFEISKMTVVLLGLNTKFVCKSTNYITQSKFYCVFTIL